MVRGPHQLLDAVAPANVRAQLHQGFPHIGVDGVGVEPVAGALHGDGPVVVAGAGRAPGAVRLVHNGTNAAVLANGIIAAAPRCLEVAAQPLHAHLAHHAVDGDGVDLVIAGAVAVRANQPHTV